MTKIIDRSFLIAPPFKVGMKVLNTRDFSRTDCHLAKAISVISILPPAKAEGNYNVND